MGIAATPKHFVANETENNRTVLSAQIDEQTLREVYLLPFQLLMKRSKPWCLMTRWISLTNFCSFVIFSDFSMSAVTIE